MLALEAWQIELLQKNLVYVALGLMVVLSMRTHQLLKKYDRKMNITVYLRIGAIFLTLFCLWMFGYFMVFYAFMEISFWLSFAIFLLLIVITEVGEKILKSVFEKWLE